MFAHMGQMNQKRYSAKKWLLILIFIQGVSKKRGLVSCRPDPPGAPAASPGDQGSAYHPAHHLPSVAPGHHGACIGPK